jgi:hypothetical protein
MDAAVRDGYATTSPDTGHDAQKEPGTSFAYPGPDNPNAARKLVDFGYRFFPVPGVFHCGGGPGCGDVDWLTAAVNWVEKGIAPSMLVGKHVERGEVKRTRPICAYPDAAKYKGSGSIDAAENFTCAAPGP